MTKGKNTLCETGHCSKCGTETKFKYGRKFSGLCISCSIHFVRPRKLKRRTVYRKKG